MPRARANPTELMLEAAGIGGWEFDVATAALRWTKRTFRIHDIATTAPPTLDRAIEFFAPASRPAIQRAMADAIETGAPWDLELSLTTARGRAIWARVCGKAIRRRGKTIKLVGTFEDITARHALAERESRLSLVAQRMTDSIIMLDRHGRIEWINDTFTRATGWTIEDLRGHRPGDVVLGPNPDPATLTHIADCIRQGIGYNVEVRNYRKDGSWRLVWVVAVPVHDAVGAVTGYITVGSDITAQRAAEQRTNRATAELGRTEALLRDVLDTLPSAVTAYDRDDRFILCNSLYAEMFPISARFAVPGRSHEEIVRLAAEHGQYADAPTEPEAREAWVRAQMLYQVAPTGVPRTMRLRDGRSVQVRERRSASGTTVHVRTDVTELRAAEETATRAAAELERTEALMRDILDTLPVGVTAYDSDNRFILHNRANAAMFPVTADLLVPGLPMEDVIRLSAAHGQYADAPANPAEQEVWVRAQIASRGASGELARPLRLSNGRRVMLQERRSARGTLVSVRTDTTELYAAEAAARREAAERERAEALLRDILDTLPIGVTAYDADNRFILFNRAYAEMFPVSAAIAVVGRPMADVIRESAQRGQYADAPRDPVALEEWIRQQIHLQEAPGAHARPLKLADGRSMLVQERRSARGTLVSVRSDTTELLAAEATARRAAAERERAEALLRDILEAMPNAITAYDSEERFVLANPAYYEMYPFAAAFAEPGRPLEERTRLIAEHDPFAELPSEPVAREAWLVNHVAMLRAASDAPHTMRLNNGRMIQVRQRRSANGSLVIVRTDISELTRAEALLRDVLEALPIAVIVYDADERYVLSNRAHGEVIPVAARATGPGQTMEGALRNATAQGQFADVGPEPAAIDAWVAEHLALLREAGSTPRTMRLADGRFTQVRQRRSESGNLVIVRTDTTELHRAEALLRDVLNALPSAVTAYDPDERLIVANRAYAELFPIAARFATLGSRLEDVLRQAAEHGQFPGAGETPEARAEWLAKRMAAHRSPGAPRMVVLPNGRCVQARESRSETGVTVCIRTDTTELVRAQALLRDVLDALPSAVTAYDRDERLILKNRALTEILPITDRVANLGDRLEDVLRLSAEHGQYPEAGATPEEQAAWVVRRLAQMRAPSPDIARTAALPDGRFVQVRESRSDNGVTVCIRTDTTDLIRAENDMRLLAERDVLTLLGNRSAFMTALERALGAAPAGQANGGALLLLDIDYFKQINDTLGHDMGDALLMEIAARLRALLRTGDVAARLGGDEFGALMPGLTNAQAVAARVDMIHAALSAPIELAGRRAPVGISVGVTMFPADGTDAAKLLKNADLALYEAKRNGRGRWAEFRPEQAIALEHHVHMADALRRALAQRKLSVALQPKRRLRGGGHAGFEALARWHDGTRWVPPSEFIPVAEDAGLIVQLGRAVMDQSLARIREIQDRGLEPGRVAVNVTGPQLLDPNFLDEVMACLRRHRLRPADLELEMTETVLLGRAAERIDSVLRAFSGLGITVALDDFGTGYASLAHLSRLPIDRLKIDRSFVDGIGAGGPGAVIARTLVSLARNLEMESIAEGIETPAQLAFLEAEGCQVGQGYLFSKPLMTTSDAITYLRRIGRRPDKFAVVPALASGVGGR